MTLRVRPTTSSAASIEEIDDGERDLYFGPLKLGRHYGGELASED